MIANILSMLKGAYVDNTIKAYASDMRVFANFIAPRGMHLYVSHELIADYIAALAEQRKSFATI